MRLGDQRRNEFDQPIGAVVDWSPREPVVPVTLVGRTCRIEPLAGRHLDLLFGALVLRSPDSLWTYLPWGPHADKPSLFGALRGMSEDPGWVPHTLCLPDGRPVGIASYLRVDRRNGSAEVGGIAYAAELQRTTAATEAMYLMMRHVFDDLGYRRYEWKCDDLNAPSRRAAERLGFRYEGTFRNALVYKGRNRDTAWYSITDSEWPAVRARLEAWLARTNFDGAGRQIAPLAPTLSGP
jgi:RimJ/RimL family protein N-acetyltransferase